MNMILILILLLVLLIPLWVLFGSGSDKESEKLLDENNRPLRRRAADRMIEDEETTAPAPLQRKPDESRTSPQTADELVDVEDDFNLPFHPAEIIPTDSPFEIYRRTIANAETYMKRGDFVTARSLYEGVLDRISDTSVRQKLEDNLEYLNNYHQVVARRQELKRQKKDLKPQEIRLTLEGADNLADRIQIGIAPEKSPIDLSEIVDKLSEKITGLAPEVAKKATQSIDTYRDELAQLRGQLRDVAALKEQVRKLNEEQMTRDRDEIDRLKRELTEIHQKTKDIQNQTHDTGKTDDESGAIPADREKQILDEIERREDENRLLRDRLDLVQKELSMLREDNSRSVALEQALASTLLKKDLSVTEPEEKAQDLSSYDREIESLKREIASLRNSQNQTDESAIPPQSMGELADALKDSMQSLTPLLSETLKNKEEKKESGKDDKDKKDDFQLLEEMINGPKFEEPTEEEVLAKILNDAVKEHAKQSGKDARKEDRPEKTDKPETSGKENLKDDFELVSDYLKGDEGNIPTDEAVMEKILRDAMKSKEFRGNVEQQENEENKLPRGFQPAVRKRKELPILRVSYNFSRLPDEFTLSIDKNHLEYSFYKFKPLLEKATELVKRRKVKDAINYYKVVMDQDIPQEFKDMLNQNIHDLNEYLTKYYTSE